MESDLLQVEFDSHVDGADDVLELRYDVRVLDCGGGGGRGGHRSVDRGASSQARLAGSVGLAAPGAQETLRGPVVGGAQHVVRGLAQQPTRGLAGSLGGEPSETVQVGLLPAGLLGLLGGGGDHLVLLHGVVGRPDTGDVKARRRQHLIHDESSGPSFDLKIINIILYSIIDCVTT